VLTIQKKGTLIELSVSDTGFGIPVLQQEKIFTKLFRADNANKSDTGGSGLGLYIVKSIVTEAGGDIRFESEEGKGTTFYITFPQDGMRSRRGNVRLK
jgi:two-component system sensor histidine kinase VicK